jgi:[ribosomal protein S5]-alanine N-acetyltransferase
MLQTDWYPFPSLTTERLVLKQMTEDDVTDLFALRSDETMMRYIDRPLAETPEDARRLLHMTNELHEAGDGINWGIYLKDAPGLIGTIGYYRMKKEDFRAEIGYMLHTEYQRKGIMTEAMQRVLDYGFNIMKAHTIIADINPLNEASMRILERNGFVREAWFRENYYYNGRFIDTMIYTKFAPDPS